MNLAFGEISQYCEAEDSPGTANLVPLYEIFGGNEFRGPLFPVARYFSRIASTIFCNYTVREARADSGRRFRLMFDRRD